MYRNQLSVIKNEYEIDLHKLLVSKGHYVRRAFIRKLYVISARI